MPYLQAYLYVLAAGLVVWAVRGAVGPACLNANHWFSVLFSFVSQLTCAAWWLVDWPIAIKKQISNSTRSDQPFQKLIYAIRYSQLSITFAVFVCISFMCFRVHVDLTQPSAARNNKRCSFVLKICKCSYCDNNINAVWVFIHRETPNSCP